MSDRQTINKSGFNDGSITLDVVALTQKLESKEREFADLFEKHQLAISQRTAMEEQLKAMKEKVEEADVKLSEVKAESEAALRQNENDHKELTMIRRRSLVGGGNPIITQMYEAILSRYEEVKATNETLQRRLNEEMEARAALERQLGSAMQNYDVERETLISQNESMREKTEALKKEIMKQQKDLIRIREERTGFKREYSLVMSERDAVHKEMDKLQEDLIQKQKENEMIGTEKDEVLKENEKLKCQLATLQQGSVSSLDFTALQEELYAALQERKQALLEKDAKVHEAYTTQKAHAMALDKIEQLCAERDVLKASAELTKKQLKEASDEAKMTTRWRVLAFSERDKLNCELEESRRICGKLTEERENLIKQLEEAVKEHDIMKEVKKKIQEKLHDLQTRVNLRHIENNESAHSHDSAIDSGNWESEPNDSCYKISRVVRMLPGQHDITIEPGVFVKYSTTPGVGVGDRIIAVGETSVHKKSMKEVNDLLMQDTSLLLHLIKFLPLNKVDDSNSSSNDGIHKNLPNGVSTTPLQTPLLETSHVWKTADAQVTLRKQKKPNHGYGNGVHNNADSIKMRGKRNEHPQSALFIDEDQSQVSGYTAHSEPVYDVKSDIPTANSEILASMIAKKKKRFWRKKKSKSALGTPSSGDNQGGTWPRLDSASLNNVLTGGGRLSVFSRKKGRLPISSSTFTPPEGPSAGHTPPTPMRTPLTVTATSPSSTSPADATDGSTKKLTEVSVSVTRARRHPPTTRTNKRQRPKSAPMGIRGLSMWQQPVDIDNDPGSDAAYLSTDNEHQPSHPNNLPYSYQSSGIEIKSYQTSVIASSAISPTLSSRSGYQQYKRQQSVPETSKLSLVLPSSNFDSSLNPLSVSASSNRPRNSQSLPRPNVSKAPTFSVTPLSNHSSNKSKTLECRRIRIPSEVSVGMKLSGSEKGSLTQSTERSIATFFPSTDQPPVHGGSSARSTPHPESSVSSLSVASSTLSTRSRRPPVSNDPRYVTMVKGVEPIGISIVSGEHGGIFVSRLTDNSLASKAGLEYGDQLLEYNGVNLRNAKEEQARVIMSQSHTGDNIKFLAQYNLEKYKQSIESNLSDTLGISKPPLLNGPILYEEKDERTITPDVTPRASPQVEEALRTQRMNEPRYVFINGGCSHVKLVGGNQVGIYVASVHSNEDTLTNKTSELKVGDRIIEFNSVSFANITLEAASLTLARCTSSASFHVIYEPNKYKQIYVIPGDHFYVRALFDHLVEQEGALQFARNAILLVENTYPDYVTGQWTAWMLDEQGGRSTRGRIPSKLTVEKERENASHFLDDVTSASGSTSGKRLSGSGRRSFFKRLKPHRTSSRSSGDIRLHRSPSENSLESTVDGASEWNGAYQVVEKHSSGARRPVVVLGAHSSAVVEKLAREHHHQFVKCSLLSLIEVSRDSEIIESFNTDARCAVLTGSMLRQTMKDHPGRHVLLEAGVEAIDRLHSIHIYPIIAFIKYTSSKKIKESQDRVIGREKITTRQCKDMLEKQIVLEQTLMSKYFGTVTISGGPTNTVAMKVSKVVSHEHSKVLWLLSDANLLNY